MGSKSRRSHHPYERDDSAQRRSERLTQPLETISTDVDDWAAKLNVKPDCSPGGVGPAEFEKIGALRLAPATELQQPKQAYDGPEQDHGAGLGHWIHQKFLHGKGIGISRYYNIPIYGAEAIGTNNALRVRQIVIDSSRESCTRAINRTDEAVDVGGIDE